MTDNEIMSMVQKSTAPDPYDNDFWVLTRKEILNFAHNLIVAERVECARACEGRYMGDNNREDMEARRCADAIRARGQT